VRNLTFSGDDYEHCHLLECHAGFYVRNDPTMLRILLPPSSGYNTTFYPEDERDLMSHKTVIFRILICSLFNRHY
jgi:hypothetical protein